MADIQKTNSEITKFVEFLHNTPGVDSFNKDIFLIKVHVAGAMFVENIDEIIPKIEKNNHLQLVREKTNPYDKKAILVKFDGDKIGYVPRKHNIVLANLMDGGKELYGVVRKLTIEPPLYHWDNEYVTISFKIFMKD